MINPREVQAVEAGFNPQEKSFFRYAKAGAPVSEVFVHFPGKMPWKKVGELVQSKGNFVEAVRAQWPLLVERSYKLYPKVRFLLPKAERIEFGYASDGGDIVAVEEGALPEAFPPLEFKKMLRRCGYLPGQKARQFIPKKIKDLDKRESKKQWHKNKRHMLDRKYYARLEATKYNANKQPGRYGDFFSGQFKRGGLVVGTSNMR